MPDFIDMWVPLILGTLRNPRCRRPATRREGEPGQRLEAAFGERPRAVGDAPSASKYLRISGWVLKRWNSS